MRSAAFKKWVAYPLTGIAFAILMAVFRLLPVAVASALGGRILRFFGPHLAGPSRIARRNLALAFPQMPEKEIDALLPRIWENLGRVMAEYPHLHALESGASGRVEVAENEHLEALLGRDGPALIITAHLGNWELFETLQARFGKPISFVYREPNNPLVARMLRHFRGPNSFAKGREGAAQLLEWLGRGNKAVLLIDQKMSNGIPVPFFGVDAMTAPAVAGLAHRFSCPIYPLHMERIGGVHFRLTVEAPVLADASKPRAAAAPETMKRLNAIVEGWVRERPEQWLWIHRRWP